MTVEELIEKLQHHRHSDDIVTVRCGNMFDETNWDYLSSQIFAFVPAKYGMQKKKKKNKIIFKNLLTNKRK